MNIPAFEVGFWHPFGPHGRETTEQILERKRQEIQANGWTLWSFQYRRPEVLDEWYYCLSSVSGSKAVVFCSHSPEAVDPACVGNTVEISDCQSFRFIGETGWKEWPNQIRVPHPFRGKKKQASAFVSERIIYPVTEFIPSPVEWLSKGQWRQDRVPTRGEYLIRRGGLITMRKIGAVLELCPPYLAVVSAEPFNSHDPLSDNTGNK
jgi:hypothetical protein